VSRAKRVALGFAANGWPVLPLRGKVPLPGTRGVLDATTDPGVIKAWPENVNVGIATGNGIVVLDVDGEEGAVSLHALERDHGPLPRTLSAETGGGGQHFYFLGHGLGNSAGRLGPGLDVRGEGGYVVAPPSIHPQAGRRYAWDERTAPVPLPDWIRERLTTASAMAPPAPVVIPEGQRNETLASVAGSMRRRGLDSVEIAAALHTVNGRRCHPPLPEREVDGIAASIATKPAADPIAGEVTSTKTETGAATANTETLATVELLEGIMGFVSRFVVLPPTRRATCSRCGCFIPTPSRPPGRPRISVSRRRRRRAVKRCCSKCWPLSAVAAGTP
jgi:hypothetical protein